MLLSFGARKANPGVAKFGIALEWGSRGRRFDSCHSDQKVPITQQFCWFSELFLYINSLKC